MYRDGSKCYTGGSRFLVRLTFIGECLATLGIIFCVKVNMLLVTGVDVNISNYIHVYVL